MSNNTDYASYSVKARMIAVLDADLSPVQNFNTICHFLGALPLNDKVEMMMTLRAFINEEFR